MRIRLLVLIALIIFTVLAVSDGLIYIKDTAEVSTSSELMSEVIKYLAYGLVVFILGRISWVFGYLALKFPKLAKVFIEFKDNIAEVTNLIEQERKSLPEVLTAKQGQELKNKAVIKVMDTKPANELRRGISNIFGLFGGRAKNLGGEIFDAVVPGLIDKQVEKVKSKIK